MIHADLSERENGWREQLWTHQVSPDTFEIACLPFFTYGICYRDIVTIDDQHLVSAAVRKSGHRTLRVALEQQHPQCGQLHELLHEKVVETGLAHEWLQGTYLAIDLPPGADPNPLVQVLQGLEGTEALSWEIDS